MLTDDEVERLFAAIEEIERLRADIDKLELLLALVWEARETAKNIQKSTLDMFS